MNTNFERIFLTMLNETKFYFYSRVLTQINVLKLNKTKELNINYIQRNSSNFILV